MILSALVSLVQQETGLQREMILRRTREAWPSCIEFKDVQVRLMVDQLKRETGPKANGRVVNLAQASQRMM